MMTRILVAVDGSTQAAVAIEMGVHLASKLGAELALLNVSEPPPAVVMADMPVCDIEPPAVRLQSARALLKKIRQSIPATMNVEELVADGHPAAQIVATAQDWNADLIILGTHGLGGIARLILGSTATTVMHKADCPVLIARGRAQRNRRSGAQREAKQGSIC